MAIKRIVILVFTVCFGFLCAIQPISLAAQTAAETVAAAQSPVINTVKLSNIRYGRYPEKTRIVLDLSAIPEYTAVLRADEKRLTITLENTELAKVLPVFSFSDNLVQQVTTIKGNDGSVTIAIDLAYLPHYEISRYSGPQRLVIDFWKIFEQKTEKQLANGLSHTAINKGTKDGLLSIHVLDYDLKSPHIKLEHVLAKDIIAGTETVKSMATRKNAIAAINGTYFSPSGELLGLIIHENQILQTPINNRSAFALTYAGDVLIDQVGFTSELVLPDGNKHWIDAVNRERGQDELIIYTSVYGPTTGTNNYGTEYIMANGKISQINGGNSIIPANGLVVSAHGSSEKALSMLKVGDSLPVKQQLDPDWLNIRIAVGAGPQLVKDGMIYLTTKTEGFGSDVAGGRAPRTAIGVNAEGHLLLVTVDGRQPGYSIGMTLIELAKLMQDLGAKNAINLDGGGSTEIVIAGEIANRPSDGRERPVGDALLLIPAEQK
jgi:exopolysaccharide biosynthesis protein